MSGDLHYAGIGSRDAPPEALLAIKSTARKLAELGFTLRSGGANGADSAFEAGCDELSGKKEIYLPWKLFNSNQSRLFSTGSDALNLAAEFHPGWQYCKDPVRKLMARNCYQVLGLDLSTPVAFVVCWTLDGCETVETRTRKTGGTGLAISLASARGITVVNLANDCALDRLAELTKSAGRKPSSSRL